MMANRHPAEIKSVSSASNNEEEDLETGGTWSDSSTGSAAGERKKVRPVVIDDKGQAPSSFASAVAASLAPIAAAAADTNLDPNLVAAPVPIQGGEDDVIQVSHVRKIKVNTMDHTTNGATNTTTVSSSLIKSTPTKPPSSSSSSNSTFAVRRDEPKKQQQQQQQGRESISRRAKGQGSSSTSNNGRDSHLLHESEISDSEPMDVIEKSPYEANFNAEKGVALFTRMKNLLKERHGDDYRTVNAEATKIFGPTNAWCLVKANALIDKSGMVYSQEWCNGNIRGEKIGKIPKDLLLVCLVSKRFVKAQDLLLSGLTRDLEISSIVQEAMEVWKIKGDFERIKKASKKNFAFTSMKRDSYKCAIFVARAYACYKAFSMTGKIDPALMAKVMTCLNVMEAHLPETNSKKRKKSEPATPLAPVSDVVSATTTSADLPPKRKRGRPRKNPLPGDATKTGTASSVTTTTPAAAQTRNNNTSSSKHQLDEDDDDDDDRDSQDSMLEDDEDDMVPYNPPAVRGRARKSDATSDSNKSYSGSLSRLVSQFEKQYTAMEKIYQQMGKTLQELKTKVEANRNTTEEEIRKELLLEVQENLLKSFGKK